MTIIKCSECGKEISDKATVCVGCGAPVPQHQNIAGNRVVRPDFENLADLNGDGRVNFEDFKLAVSKIKESSPELLDSEDPKAD